MLSAPLATGNETVVAISRDLNGSFVATDKNVYRFGDGATAVVTIDQQLCAGQALTDAFSMRPLTSAADLPYLTVQPSMINICNIQPIAFQNSPESISVSTVNGYTYVSWPLIGNTNDITAFFNTAHTEGIARINQFDSCGKLEPRGTIAQWLDTRKNAIGEPTAANLPATINPFAFLCDNCLQGNSWLATIRLASCGSDGVGLHYMSALRRYLPKEVALFFAVETSSQDAEVQGWLRDAVTILPDT